MRDQTLDFSNCHSIASPNHCYQINAAGERIEHLLKEVWHSSVTYGPISRIEKFTTQVFYGDYDLYLYHDGELLWKHHVEVSPENKHSFVVEVEDPLHPQRALHRE